MSLKYEYIEPGQRIRAYDFDPCEGRRDRYVEGLVVGHYTGEGGVLFLHMEVHVDTSFMKHPRQEVMVPVETDMDCIWRTDRVSVI